MEDGLRWGGGNVRTVSSPRGGLGEGRCRKRRKCIEEEGREGYIENYKMVLREIQEDNWESTHVHALARNQAISEQPTDLVRSVSEDQQLFLFFFLQKYENQC
jgi:hypothetical protein